MGPSFWRATIALRLQRADNRPMTRSALSLGCGAALALLSSTAAYAQVGAAPPPLGTPVGAAGMPASMGANDSATMPSDSQQRVLAERNAQMDRAAADARKDRARPAKPDEVKAGATIADKKGVEVGYIRSVDADGAVVATTGGQVRVPVQAFGITKNGLVLGVTKADFDAIVAKANAG
jgi:hypothetical protein